MSKDIALHLYDAGLMVIPVRDKRPLVKWGDYHEKRATREEVERWWSYHDGANIGVVTGQVSGVIVLDQDGAEGGNSLGTRSLPPTWTDRTKNDGKHYWYAFPKELKEVPTTITSLLPSVDVRGEGGYVVVVADGYAWEPGCAPWETDLAPAPQWLIDAIKDRSKTEPRKDDAPADNWLSRILEGVGEGERHSALVKLASYYLSRMPADVTRKLLVEWNAKNSPPMDEQELHEQIDDLVFRFKNGNYTARFQPPAEQAPVSEIKILSASDVMKKFSNKIDWIVEGLIPKGSSTVFSGWQGRGKSWLVVDLATEIARGGGKWFGHLPTCAGRVLYVDNENAGTLISKRLSLMLPAKHIDPEKLEMGFFVRDRIKLTHPGQMQQLKDRIAEFGPTLVVIDSFASCHTLDENNSGQMRHFFDDVIAPVIDEFGCGFMFIDHESKGLPGVEVHGSKRTRGSSAKMDAADVGLSLNLKENVLILEHTKARWARALKPMTVSIEDVKEGVEVQFRGVL